MFKIVSVIFAILGLVYSQADQDVTISLFATDLNGCDDGSACDTVVVIMCASASSDWKECGRTAKIQDDNYPVFPERFIFNFVASENQRWRFDLTDEDAFFNDPIGSVQVGVEEYLTATPPFQTMRFNISGRGMFHVHHRENTIIYF